MKISYPEKDGTGQDLKFNNHFGKYLINHLNTWHGGVHIEGKNKSIQAIADGKIIAYRFSERNELLEKIESTTANKEEDNNETEEKNYKYANSFILIQHDIKLVKDTIENQGTDNETTKSEHKYVTFYSIYNHLMPIKEIETNTELNIPDFIGKKETQVTGKGGYEYKVQGLKARILRDNGKVNVGITGVKLIIPFGKRVTKRKGEDGKIIKKDKYIAVSYLSDEGVFYDDIFIFKSSKFIKDYPNTNEYEIVTSTEDTVKWTGKQPKTGARLRHIANDKGVIIDIIPNGEKVIIKEEKGNWRSIEGYEGYTHKINLKTTTFFDDSKATRKDITACNIPIKAGQHIGYTGFLESELSTGYTACQVDVFMVKGAKDFLDNTFGAGTGEKHFIKLPQGTILRKRIKAKVVLNKNLPVTIIDLQGIYAKIKVIDKIEKTITVKGNIWTADTNSNDGTKKGYNSTRGYHILNFTNVNKIFYGLLTQGKSSLIYVSGEGTLKRTVEFIPTEAGKEYWVELKDLSPNVTDIEKKITKTVPKSLSAFESFCSYFIDVEKTELITKTVCVPKKLPFKIGEKNRLTKQIRSAYIIIPNKITDFAEPVYNGEGVIVDLRKTNEKTANNKTYIQVTCSYSLGTVMFKQKGWIEKPDKNKLKKEVFSAYNWGKFGFKPPLEAGTEYMYDIEGLRDSKKTESDFINKLWSKLDSTNDNIIDVFEIDAAYKTLETQNQIAKMVCNHKTEWSYKPQEIADEVSVLYDYLISKQKPEVKSELETIKQKKLKGIKGQVEKLMWWDEAKENDKKYKPPVKEEDKTKTSSTKRLSMLPEGEQVEQKTPPTPIKDTPQKDIVPLDNKTTAPKPDAKPTGGSLPTETKVEEKEEPPKRMFPSTNMVYHFHPIAWIEQMKLIYGDGGTDECPSLVWGKKVSCEFRKRVIQISKRLECDPNHLMGAMALETGGKFNPKVDNGLVKDADGIGYIGLIQMGNDAITDLNRDYFIHRAKIKKKDLRAMSAVEQLCYVEYYLAKHKGKLKTLADFYLAILLPYDVGKGGEKDHVVFDSSLLLNYYPNGKVKKDLNWVRNKGYAANPTFFKEKTDSKGNKNGKTYVWEIAEAIQEWYNKGIPETNTSSNCTCNKNCSCGKDCIDLTDKVTWISQFNKSERKNGVMNTGGCWRTSQELLMSAGLSKTSGYKTDMIITALEDNKHTSLSLTKRVKEGVEYIDTELEKGNPVLVGLNHTINYRHNGKIINVDSDLGDPGTTDHYIVIVGRGCENDKIYYRFYEVGTSWAHHGQSSSNKLLLGDDFSLKGTPAHSTSKNYTVSQVRKN